MRILLIGRSGQVATALALRAGRHEVVALGRPEADLTAPETLVAALSAVRPDVVVNAAAYTAVDAAESDPAAAFALNAAGAGALARLAADADVPLVHLSTDYVFDGALHRPYREDDPVGPMSVYGRSKLAGEEAVLEAGGRGIIARTAWVYAPFGSNFLRTMLRLGAERSVLRVVDDQRGNPTSALDLADAVIAVAEAASWRPMEVVHVAGTGEATWHDFAEAIIAASPFRPALEPIPTSAYPTAAARPANSRLDCGLLAARWGVRLPDWRASSAECVRRALAG